MLVMVGDSSTLSVKIWLAEGLKPLAALSVKVYVPPLPTGGVPVNEPVPSPLSFSVNQAGNCAPVRLSVALGTPEVVMAKLPAVPTAKVAAFELVKAGAVPTFRVAAMVVAVPTTLVKTARYMLPSSPAAAVKV